MVVSVGVSVRESGLKVLKGIKVILKTITLDIDELESSKKPKSNLE